MPGLPAGRVPDVLLRVVAGAGGDGWDAELRAAEPLREEVEVLNVQGRVPS